MNGLLLPSTDGGVLMQLVGATMVFAAVTWALHRRPEWRLLVIGLWICAYAFMGARALH